jgi:lipase chaperone LimK
MSRRILVGAALVVIVVTAAAIAWQARRLPEPPNAVRPEAVGEEEEMGSASTAAPRAPEPGAPAVEPPRDLPASLRGTQVDGGLAADTAGHFVPTRDALRFFDWFLAATGEESEAQLHARIERAIGERLAEPAAGEARDLLARYLAYRSAVAELAATGQDAADLDKRLQLLRELRRAHFGAEVAAALFAEDEQVARVALERERLRRDPSLSEAERERRIAALRDELPASVRAAQDAAVAPLRLLQDERRLRAEGASEAEIRLLREERFGPEAADRLEALDRRRSEWRRRLEDYRRERDRILADPALDDAGREAALRALREARFDERERARLDAQDALP